MPIQEKSYFLLVTSNLSQKHSVPVEQRVHQLCNSDLEQPNWMFLDCRETHVFHKRGFLFCFLMSVSGEARGKKPFTHSILMNGNTNPKLKAPSKMYACNSGYAK